MQIVFLLPHGDLMLAFFIILPLRGICGQEAERGKKKTAGGECGEEENGERSPQVAHCIVL